MKKMYRIQLGFMKKGVCPWKLERSLLLKNADSVGRERIRALCRGKVPQKRLRTLNFTFC
jgi:hypothetical protein